MDNLNVLKCAYCFSTNVKVIDSTERREAAIVRCEDCGRESEIDVENPNVSVTDPSKDLNREPRS